MTYPKLHTLSDRLRWARQQKEMTQTELADRVGATRDAIARVETNQTRQPRNIELIAEVLEVSPAWLQFGFEEIDNMDEAQIELASKYRKLSTHNKEIVDKLIDKLSEIENVTRLLDLDQ